MNKFEMQMKMIHIFNAMIYILLMVQIYVYIHLPKPINPAEYYQGYHLDGDMAAALYEEYRINTVEIWNEIKRRKCLIRKLIMPLLSGFVVTMYGICTETSRQIQNGTDLNQIDDAHDNQQEIVDQDIIPNKEGTGKKLHGEC